jgi:hypothetical protein
MAALAAVGYALRGIAPSRMNFSARRARHSGRVRSDLYPDRVHRRRIHPITTTLSCTPLGKVTALTEAGDPAGGQTCAYDALDRLVDFASPCPAAAAWPVFRRRTPTARGWLGWGVEPLCYGNLSSWKCARR